MLHNKMQINRVLKLFVILKFSGLHVYLLQGGEGGKVE